MNPGTIYEFQDFAAQYFTSSNGQFTPHSTDSSIKIYPEAITIDTNPLVFVRSPSLVIDYGACLNGRGYIGDQIGFVNKHTQPFAYCPLTRTHFINQTLIDTYDVNYGPGTAQAVLEGHLYIGCEDGVAAATDEIIRAQKEHDAPVDSADIILCTGTHHIDAASLRHGITNAPTLLKESGALVIRSLARPANDEIGTEEVASWAFEAGFSDKNVIRYTAALESPGVLLRTGHFGKSEIQTLILTK
jgi:hypothetical protein